MPVANWYPGCVMDSNRSDLPGCFGRPIESLDPDRPEVVHALYVNWLYKIMSASKGKRDVAPEWLDTRTGFIAFYEYLAPTWFSGAQLARRLRNEEGELIKVDGDLPYAPGTCEWATPEENRSDLSNDPIVEGKKYRVESDWVTVWDVAGSCGLSYNLAYARLRAGWDRWDDLMLPEGARRQEHRVQRRYYRILGFDKPQSLGALFRYAEENHLPVTYHVIQSRLESGVRDKERLFCEPNSAAHQPKRTAKKYEIDGGLYTRREVEEAVPDSVRHLVPSRLHRGWCTWEDLCKSAEESRRSYRKTC